MHEALSTNSLRPVCFITGASSGIGAALAVEYAQDGYSVAITGRRVANLQVLAQRLQQLDSACEVLVLEADVCDEQRMSDCLDQTQDRFSRIDVVIANAGYVVGGNFEDLSIDDYRNQMETNVFGVLHTLNPAVQYLKARAGSIAIIGSVNSYVASPSVSAYAMSKFAVRALADSLYYELKPYKICVTMICPGFVKSDIRSRDAQGKILEGKQDYVGRIAMDADAAAKKIKRAIDRRKREVVITFHGKVAVCLKHFLPALSPVLFRMQRRKKS